MQLALWLSPEVLEPLQAIFCFLWKYFTSQPNFELNTTPNIGIRGIFAFGGDKMVFGHLGTGMLDLEAAVPVHTLWFWAATFSSNINAMIVLKKSVEWDISDPWITIHETVDH